MNVTPGRLLKSAFTMEAMPRLARAPLRMPQGKCNSRAAACLEAMSSEAYRSNHLNLLSDRTNTPLWLVCSLSIWEVGGGGGLEVSGAPRGWALGSDCRATQQRAHLFSEDVLPKLFTDELDNVERLGADEVLVRDCLFDISVTNVVAHCIKPLCHHGTRARLICCVTSKVGTKRRIHCQHLGQEVLVRGLGYKTSRITRPLGLHR